MKRILSIILLALISITAIFGLVACDSQPGNPETDKGIHVKSVEGGYLVTDYVEEENVDTLDILAAVKLKTNDNNAVVVKIKSGAFSGNSSLKSIIVPGTVKEIGAGAFAKMTKLESLTIPFVGQTAIADVELGSNAGLDTPNKSVDSERTFAHLFGTDEYTGGALMTAWFSNATEGSSVEVYVPATLKEINVNPTVDTLTQIKEENNLDALPNGYVIPTYAFGGLTMVQVNFGGLVMGLGDKVFYNANFVDVSVNLPATITQIHETAFEGLTSKLPIKYAGDIDWSGIDLPEEITTEKI